MARPDYLEQVRNRINAEPPGTAFVPSDFFDITDTSTINKVLSRLAENGSIRRIIRGVYDRPCYSLLLMEYAAPDMEQVATAIARNFGWHIVPCGDSALNLLKLSTQVPVVWQYVSDGPYREYTIGKLLLKFRHVSNKDLAAKSYKTALVIQALKALGKEHIDDTIKQKLAAALSAEELETAVAETQRGTTWIHEVLKSILVMEKNYRKNELFQ